jgi:hypothetical protein
MNALPTPLKNMTEQERTHYALKGDYEAIEYCNMYFRVCQTWDDLIDKDVPITETQIHHAFITAMIELPSNKFFQRHCASLVPIMYNGIMDWQASVAMERTNDVRQKLVAYTLRDTFNNLILHCAYILGGKEWVDHINYAYRVNIYGEPVEHYLEEL